ncbi:MAG: hypothetical protein JNK09_01140 [Prolixibacteraceae bacterium]|nr:hypothetical protein [Prolixibacteraceae bacterium]
MLDNDKDIDPRDLPIYKKGEEIFHVVNQICHLIDDEDQFLGHIKSIMLKTPCC